jgi:hypothetical protein
MMMRPDFMSIQLVKSNAQPSIFNIRKKLALRITGAAAFRTMRLQLPLFQRRVDSVNVVVIVEFGEETGDFFAFFVG